MRGVDPLLAPQLLADGVGDDLVPVDLGPGDRELSPQRLRRKQEHDLHFYSGRQSARNYSIVSLASLHHLRKKNI